MSSTEGWPYRRAAEIIRTGGLAKGEYETFDGEHCTIGALREASGESELIEGKLLDPVADLIGRKPAETTFTTITIWNDVDGRTVEDVVALLEQVAEKVEANQ